MGGLEYWIMTIGAKTCCIAASGCGGAAYAITQKQYNLDGLKNILVAIVVGWVAAEFFIPPIMKHWALEIIWGPAIAFMVGYSGIRLLPVIEGRMKRFIEGDSVQKTVAPIESEITQRRLREALLSDEGMEWLMEQDALIKAARDAKEKK